MPLFDKNTSKQIKEVFSNLQNDVKIAFFKQDDNCETCKSAGEFAEEITALSDKLNLSVYDLEKDKDTGDKYSIDKTPAYSILDSDGKDYGVRFFGIPGGHEINSFIGSLMEVSGKKEELSEEITKRIAAINQKVHLEVFVTLS